MIIKFVQTIRLLIIIAKLSIVFGAAATPSKDAVATTGKPVQTIKNLASYAYSMFSSDVTTLREFLKYLELNPATPPPNAEVAAQFRKFYDLVDRKIEESSEEEVYLVLQIMHRLTVRKHDFSAWKQRKESLDHYYSTNMKCISDILNNHDMTDLVRLIEKFVVRAAIMTNHIGIPIKVSRKPKPAPAATWYGKAAAPDPIAIAAEAKKDADRQLIATAIKSHRENQPFVNELHVPVCKSITLLYKLAVDWKAHKKPHDSAIFIFEAYIKPYGSLYCEQYKEPETNYNGLYSQYKPIYETAADKVGVDDGKEIWYDAPETQTQ